jgi:hypothetical protein
MRRPEVLDIPRPAMGGVTICTAVAPEDVFTELAHQARPEMARARDG